jgi:hypothetical protein
MKSIIYFFALMLPLLSLGCEKTIHEVSSPLPTPTAAVALR